MACWHKLYGMNMYVCVWMHTPAYLLQNKHQLPNFFPVKQILELIEVIQRMEIHWRDTYTGRWYELEQSRLPDKARYLKSTLPDSCMAKQVTWQSTLFDKARYLTKHITWFMHGKACYLLEQSTLPDKARYLIHARQSTLPDKARYLIHARQSTLPDSCTAKHVTWLMRGKCMQLSAGPQQEVMLGSKDHGCIEQLRALKGLIVDRRICRRSRPRVTIQ